MSWRDVGFSSYPFRMKTGSGLRRRGLPFSPPLRRTPLQRRKKEKKEAFQIKRIMKRKVLIAVSIRPLVFMLVHAREELSFKNRSINEQRGAIEANETKLGMIFAEFD